MSAFVASSPIERALKSEGVLGIWKVMLFCRHERRVVSSLSAKKLSADRRETHESGAVDSIVESVEEDTELDLTGRSVLLLNDDGNHGKVVHETELIASLLLSKRKVISVGDGHGVVELEVLGDNIEHLRERKTKLGPPLRAVRKKSAKLTLESKLAWKRKLLSVVFLAVTRTE